MSKATRTNIKKLLDLTGVTHKQLGKIAGVGRSTVSHWVSGKSEPRMGALQKIADYYGLSVENLTNPDGMRFVTRGPDGRLRDDKKARMASLRRYLTHLDDDEYVGEIYSKMVTVYRTDSVMTLSDDERELVTVFRSMNSEGRKMLLMMERALADSHNYDAE